MGMTLFGNRKNIDGVLDGFKEKRAARVGGLLLYI